MKKILIGGGIVLAVAVLFAFLVAGDRENKKNAPADSGGDGPFGRDAGSAPPPPVPALPPPPTEKVEGEADPSFLYGRITTVNGGKYEGRIRWGEKGEEEASWGDYFNGSKNGNQWVSYLPPEKVPKVSHRIEVLGLKFGSHESEADLGRLFMARFGDIARIEAQGRRDVRVILKSGTVFDLNRMDASDLDDGVRLWNAERAGMEFNSLQIRSIELFPTDHHGATPPNRLHGTVKTRAGEFTGDIQWDREECVGTDKLGGYAGRDEMLDLRFDTIRSIEKSARGSAVTMLDGQRIELEGTNDVNRENRGIYVDDPRYGRVLVNWDAFERVDFSPAAGGPAYGDFPPGVPLKGTVTTHDGRRLHGRIVYDLDESETTETFDAPMKGVDYTIPFGLVASIAVRGADDDHSKVVLRTGEELQLERRSDLGSQNAGMLVFAEGANVEYVPWADVSEVEFERPAAMYPPIH